MDIMIHALDIAGSEWFIIILTIIIVLVPSRITSISKIIGKFIGEFEKTKNSLIEEKNSLVNDQSLNNQKYKGPSIHRPISSEREKLEIIAKSLNLDIENKSDDELRKMISSHLK
jgi:sec-independent protein translocase protein TatA